MKVHLAALAFTEGIYALQQEEGIEGDTDCETCRASTPWGQEEASGV